MTGTGPISYLYCAILQLLEVSLGPVAKLLMQAHVSHLEVFRHT